MFWIIIHRPKYPLIDPSMKRRPSGSECRWDVSVCLDNILTQDGL